jgi:hypothetical protein
MSHFQVRSGQASFNCALLLVTLMYLLFNINTNRGTHRTATQCTGIEALGGKTALSRKHHSEINQFEII